MALFLLIFAVCTLIIGGMLLILLFSRTARYRTEPEHLLELFDKALENRLSQHEWDTIINYPIRHDDYLDGVRRRAHRLMEAHGRAWRIPQGKPLLDTTGQEELAALRDHLAAHTRLRNQRRDQDES
ncbi:hypothetical protein KZO25_01335 [Halomonas sp. ANAO-440]|uniref:hypothetical protein n=1 Tax=Halomonas sp. ANAO-440 TaxID=2861360 RepID=UPI001CAA7F96|nr:hypothetical protein [Halomonas sp. ANAO-440]MBZ0328961.1 hypothetical protein [Halomonas sp. ANAO-440]